MRVNRTVGAPADLFNPMIAISEGSDLTIDLMAESVIEGVLITGTAAATMEGSCSRCLEPVSAPIEVEVLELFRYADQAPITEDEDELPTLEGSLLDLEPTLRDAVVLALPLAPVCSEDCPGLCPQCGARLADQPDHYHHQTDPRWASLAGVFGDTGRGTERDPDQKD